mgnify:CR=1 FL=1
MRLFKKFLIWIPIMTLSAVIGVFVVYLILDKQVSESSMAIGVASGVIGGIFIAGARHSKMKNKI